MAGKRKATEADTIYIYYVCVCVFIKPTRMFTMSEKIKVRGWDYLDD